MPSLFDAPLTPEQEQQFIAWAKAAGRENDTQDYDLRGAWLANAQQAANGHLPDTYKKPNHPTFSDESQYSTPDNPGGQWADAGGGSYNFWASPTNLQNQTVTGLLNYFKQREPGNNVFFPFDYNMPNGR